MTEVKRQHVVPRDDGRWAVKPEGGEKASKVFESKHQAIRMAHKRADKHDVGMVVHDKDGTFKEFDEPPHYPSAITDRLLHG